jgi:signal transduction histidine kinase
MDPDRRIAVLVHEVRSPVAALSAIAEAVAESTDVGRGELVRLCLGACAAIERLVTDITVASVRPIRIDVRTIVCDAALARELAGDVVTVDIDGHLPPVDGDPVRLRQAFDNLLANAFVHATGSGSVEITARATPTAITVSVSDDGPGIPADDLVRIFDAGVRLDADGRGAGLGLAITRAIVGAHGGSLGVDSSPGSGTTFTITLPRSRDRHPDT